MQSFMPKKILSLFKQLAVCFAIGCISISVSHMLLMLPQRFPSTKQFLTLQTFKLAIGKTFECVKCPLMAPKTILVAKPLHTHLAIQWMFSEVQVIMPVSRWWMREALATNPAGEWPQAFMDVLVQMKTELRLEASVTVHAAPKVVLTVHLAAELVVIGKGKRSWTDHEALLTLYGPICIKSKDKLWLLSMNFVTLLMKWPSVPDKRGVSGQKPNMAATWPNNSMPENVWEVG